MKNFGQLIMLIFSIVLVSCQNSGTNEKAAPISADKIIENMNVEKTDAKATTNHPGKAVYMKYCMACHLSDGTGVRGNFPPLTDPKWISDKEQIIEITLKGHSGKIEVNGKKYNSVMPPHAHLSDIDLANVLSYVRSSFGNQFDAVSPEEIKAGRRKLNK